MKSMFKLKAVFFLVFTFALLLSACISDAPALLPTETPQPTVEPTGTIQWFPPTKTPTLLPDQAVTPTPLMNPGIGGTIYTDDFNSEGSWQIFSKAEGNAAIAGSRLTLTIPEKGNRVYSLLTGLNYEDFYLEMTANPVLCREGDGYGVLFRVSSLQDYYRLLLNCRGQVRLERVRNGEVTVLQDWTLSSQLAPGAGLPVQIGIWARGGDLRIFFNHTYQFGASDAAFAMGQIGVHARSESDSAVTVNFSNLTIHELEP